MGGPNEAAPYTTSDVERFVRHLVAAYKAARLYPPSSDIPRTTAQTAVESLSALLANRSELRLTVSKDALLLGDEAVLAADRSVASFVLELYNRRVTGVSFSAGVVGTELREFLGVLLEEPDAIEEGGGFAARLWDRHVAGIEVDTLATRIVDVDPLAAQAANWPPDAAYVTSVLELPHARRPEDRRLLVRFLGQPDLVAGYVRSLVEAERGQRTSGSAAPSAERAGDAAAAAVASKAIAMARLIGEDPSPDRAAVLRSVAEGLLGLESAVLRDALAGRLLPEARVDAAAVDLIRQFSLDELARALVSGARDEDVSTQGVARALRNLLAIGLATRDEVLEAARGALLAEGVEAGTVTALIEGVRAGTLSPHPQQAGEESVIRALELVDLAAAQAPSEAEGLEALRVEAAAGVTDADVLMGLVALVTLDQRPDTLGALADVIAHGLGVLVEMGEWGAAAEAMEELNALVGRGESDSDARLCIRDAVRAMGEPARVRLACTALREQHPGSAEYDACKRFLAAASAHSVESLLEALADEPDMAVRKVLVDAASAGACGQVGRLGAHLSDPRWYVVRNVVSIMGATRDPEVVSFLSRTLRHADARVRRETIRALAGIRDHRVPGLLVAALADDDAQNVGLAARQLGLLGAGEATEALAAVARGEGRGNRDVTARTEAIEALGRLGTHVARSVLEDLASRRSVLRQAQARAVREAAEAALAASEHRASERTGQ